MKEFVEIKTLNLGTTELRNQYQFLTNDKRLMTNDCFYILKFIISLFMEKARKNKKTASFPAVPYSCADTLTH